MVENKTSGISPKPYSKFQASVFVNADEIIPTHSLIPSLQSKLSQFNLFQNIVYEQSPLGQKPRIGFINLDSKLIIALASNRFDVVVSTDTLTNTDLGFLSDFLTQATNFLSILLSHFKLRGNRIAIITERNFEEFDDSEGRELAPRLFKLPQIMQGKKSKEFDWRVVANIDKEVKGNSETFNAIVTIKRGNFVLIENKGGSSTLSTEKNLANIQLDINTLAENQEKRIDENSIANFFDSASKLQIELSDEIHSLLEGR